MLRDNTPILVGAGQCTEALDVQNEGSTPLDLLEKAAHRSADNASLGNTGLSDIDTLVVVRSFWEYPRNTAETLGIRIGAAKADCYMMPNGGNGPQYLVNRFAEEITSQKRQMVLLAGAEAIATSRHIVKQGRELGWDVAARTDPQYLVEESQMGSKQEIEYGFHYPIVSYPMFENALRKKYGHSIEEHQNYMGRLFAPFSEVASRSPYAWYKQVRTPEEISWPSSNNRYVGWPYTKYMNAMNQINQSAALILTSVGYAKEKGIPSDKWVFLHGCADANDTNAVIERESFCESRPLRTIANESLGAASLSIGDIAHLDFYSCFPSAVAIACDSFGVEKESDRQLTVTGGLPYHGGAGNNYTMNAIASMMDVLREDPGSYGLTTGNGGYLSKHSAGIYSTRPVEGTWSRTTPQTYQAKIDHDRIKIKTEASPEGSAIIETYTVMHGKDGQPSRGMMYGRMGSKIDDSAPRFLAFINENDGLLKEMTQTDFMHHEGEVRQVKGKNIFEPK